MTLKEVKKQAEISAKEVIRQLQESIEHGFMTFPELIRILESCLEKTKIDINVFKPGGILTLTAGVLKGWPRKG